MNEEQERMLTAWNDPPASQAEEIAEARLWAAEQKARLITAAPEMLKALKQAHAMIHDHDFGGAIITIEDAITKAEGREP